MWYGSVGKDKMTVLPVAVRDWSDNRLRRCVYSYGIYAYHFRTYFFLVLCVLAEKYDVWRWWWRMKNIFRVVCSSVLYGSLQSCRAILIPAHSAFRVVRFLQFLCGSWWSAFLSDHWWSCTCLPGSYSVMTEQFCVCVRVVCTQLVCLFLLRVHKHVCAVFFEDKAV